MRVTGILGTSRTSPTPRALFRAHERFLDRWGDEVAHATGLALVNADPSRTDEVAEALQQAVGPYFDAPASDQDNFARRVRDTIDVEVTVLAVFAVAPPGRSRRHRSGPARSAGTTSTDLGTRARSGLIAAGWSSCRPRWRQPSSSARSPPCPRVALSSLFPRGLARMAEPGPGLWIDLGCLAVGAVLVLVPSRLTVLTTWRSVRASGRASSARFRRADLVERLASSVPPPCLGSAPGSPWRGIVAGGRRAGRDRARPCWSAVIGAATIERSRDNPG